MTGVRQVTLLVCGEPMRGDDGVASAVLSALPAATRSLARVVHVGQLMPDDLLTSGGGPVILLDAVAGPEPGEIIDLPLAALRDTGTTGISPASSHALPMPITVEVARLLGGGLPEGRFIGVAGASYGLGTDLSPAVQAAVPDCAQRLNHWIRVLAHETRARVCA
jgi:hydrogenase maturation protease